MHGKILDYGGVKLKIKSAIDCNKDESGIKISDEDMQKVNIEYDEKQNKQWNYRITPVIKS
jgi:hypothetical protein